MKHRDTYKIGVLRMNFIATAKLQMSKSDNFAINLFMCDKDEVGRVDQRLWASTDHVIKRRKMGVGRLKMGARDRVGKI